MESIICPTCGRPFDSNDALEVHEEQRHGEEKAPIPAVLMPPEHPEKLAKMTVAEGHALQDYYANAARCERRIDGARCRNEAEAIALGPCGCRVLVCGDCVTSVIDYVQNTIQHGGQPVDECETTHSIHNLALFRAVAV